MKKHSNTSQTQSLASEILLVSVIVSHVLQTERSKSQDNCLSIPLHAATLIPDPVLDRAITERVFCTAVLLSL